MSAHEHVVLDHNRPLSANAIHAKWLCANVHNDCGQQQDCYGYSQVLTSGALLLQAESVLLDPVEHGEEPFRFCQQCGKLEPLSEFEGAKRFVPTAYEL